MTPLDRLVEAAKVWADFQDPDSLLDQKTDRRLRIQAEVARQALLYAIDNLMEGAEKPPAWVCAKCGQTNSGWSRTCGRCEDS